MSDNVFCRLSKMRSYFYTIGLDQRSERYIRDKRIKDIGSTVSCLLLSLLLFILLFFPPSFLGQLMTCSKTMLQAVLFWLYKFFDSLLQWQINVNSSALSRFSFFPKRSFLTDSQQKNFYIHRCTLGISKLVATWEVNVKQRASKKSC